MTLNLSDFSKQVLAPLGIEVIPPDKFLVSLFREDTTKFLHTIHAHRTSLQKPPQTVPQYLETLKICGLHDLATLLAAYPEEC